jgi:transposase
MDDSTDPDPEVSERARGPRRYSAKYKARILEEYEKLNKAGKGALLRREGLYTSLISEWRKQRDRGALEALAKPAGRQPADPRDREVARLRREERAPGCRAGQGPPGDRGPGKALGAIGAVRHRQRPDDGAGRDETRRSASSHR